MSTVFSFILQWISVQVDFINSWYEVVKNLISYQLLSLIDNWKIEKIGNDSKTTTDEIFFSKHYLADNQLFEKFSKCCNFTINAQKSKHKNCKKMWSTIFLKMFEVK